MKSNLTWLLAGVLLCAVVLGGFLLCRATDISPPDTAPVNQTVHDVIISADKEREIAEQHKTTIEREVVVIREKTLQRVQALPPDELVATALARIERFSRALSADHSARPPGLDIE